jgi:hypothetical protein
MGNQCWPCFVFCRRLHSSPVFALPHSLTTLFMLRPKTPSQWNMARVSAKSDVHASFAIRVGRIARDAVSFLFRKCRNGKIWTFVRSQPYVVFPYRRVSINHFGSFCCMLNELLWARISRSARTRFQLPPWPFWCAGVFKAKTIHVMA